MNIKLCTKKEYGELGRVWLFSVLWERERERERTRAGKKEKEKEKEKERKQKRKEDHMKGKKEEWRYDGVRLKWAVSTNLWTIWEMRHQQSSFPALISEKHSSGLRFPILCYDSRSDGGEEDWAMGWSFWWRRRTGGGSCLEAVRCGSHGGSLSFFSPLAERWAHSERIELADVQQLVRGLEQWLLTTMHRWSFHGWKRKEGRYKRELSTIQRKMFFFSLFFLFFRRREP